MRQIETDLDAELARLDRAEAKAAEAWVDPARCLHVARRPAADASPGSVFECVDCGQRFPARCSHPVVSRRIYSDERVCVACGEVVR